MDRRVTACLRPTSSIHYSGVQYIPSSHRRKIRYCVFSIVVDSQTSDTRFRYCRNTRTEYITAPQSSRFCDPASVPFGINCDLSHRLIEEFDSHVHLINYIDTGWTLIFPKGRRRRAGSTRVLEHGTYCNNRSFAMACSVERTGCRQCRHQSHPIISW